MSLTGVLHSTNSTGMVLTTIGNLPEPDGNGTSTGTSGRWLMFHAAWGLPKGGLDADIG